MMIAYTITPNIYTQTQIYIYIPTSLSLRSIKDHSTHVELQATKKENKIKKEDPHRKILTNAHSGWR
jgi:hypothetical protein